MELSHIMYVIVVAALLLVVSIRKKVQKNKKERIAAFEVKIKNEIKKLGEMEELYEGETKDALNDEIERLSKELSNTNQGNQGVAENTEVYKEGKTLDEYIREKKEVLDMKSNMLPGEVETLSKRIEEKTLKPSTLPFDINDIYKDAERAGELRDSDPLNKESNNVSDRYEKVKKELDMFDEIEERMNNYIQRDAFEDTEEKKRLREKIYMNIQNGKLKEALEDFEKLDKLT